MSTILAFPVRKEPPHRPALEQAASADNVIIFPGVRYEALDVRRRPGDPPRNDAPGSGSNRPRPH
jgi:hypothetical protein